TRWIQCRATACRARSPSATEIFRAAPSRSNGIEIGRAAHNEEMRGFSAPHFFTRRVEGRLHIDAGGTALPEDLDLEQAVAFVFGQGGRHITLRHRLAHIVGIAA